MLELDRLSVRFGSEQIQDAISLIVAAGDTVALTGPSGSGKTTLLRCCCGLERPAAGTVRVDGQAMTPETVWALRRKIAYVPQEPELGEGTVREWLDAPFVYHANRHLQSNDARRTELFERLQLDPMQLDARIETLSGGEKQRVALIGALQLERPILLLDEPTSALDAEARAAVDRLLCDGEVCATLAVLHDPGDLAAVTRVETLTHRRDHGRG